MSVYVCRIDTCSLKFFSARALISHMSLSHTDDSLTGFVCNIDSCPNMYQTVSAYRKHLSRQHLDHWNLQCTSKSSCPINDHLRDSCDMDDDCNDDIEEEMDVTDETCHSVLQFKEELAKSVVITKLKSTEVHMLPKCVGTSIFESVHDLVDTCQFGMQDIIRNRLLAMGIDYHSDEILAETLDGGSFFGSVQTGVSSDHLMQKYVRENMKIVEPVPVYVATNEQSTTSRSLVGHYVPILPNIVNYLQHGDVWSSYMNNRSSSNMLYDYADGLLWKLHGLAEDHLRLHLYTDEFEVCNPLGSRKGTHKICAFYYTVGNVEVKYRSHLRNIHLAMLLNYKSVRKFGYAKVLEPLLRDLKVLEDTGINISIDGDNFVLKGSVVTLSGDNLSMHSIGGFNPAFNSGRICRHCMVCYSDIRRVKSEEDCVLRTPESHKYHVESVLKDNDLRAVYGVYGESPLSCLSYFDPVQCLPPDIMHDVLEGVMGFSVELIVQKLVLQRIVSMKLINSCMESFQYGAADACDKPQALPIDFVNKKKTISGKAVEKWCLFRLLPLFIGSFVPTDCLEWSLYLNCRQICDFILSPVINTNELGLLEVLISHHHHLLAEIGPSYFKPKTHYLIHFPRLMLLFGPLRPLWSMRFESNHQYFKQLAKRVRNFRNITHTLSQRYQLKKCLEQAGTDCLGSSITFADFQKPLAVKSVPRQLQEKLMAKFGLTYETQFRSVSWLTVDGCRIFLNGLLILDKTEDNMPTFLQIMHILHHMGLWVVCGKLVISECFQAHYHAYQLRYTDEWIAIAPSEAGH